MRIEETLTLLWLLGAVPAFAMGCYYQMKDNRGEPEFYRGSPILNGIFSAILWPVILIILIIIVLVAVAQGPEHE